MRKLLLAMIAACAWTSADARPHWGGWRHWETRHWHEHRPHARFDLGRGRLAYSDGRPAHAWCGWWLRGHVAHDPGPAFNLAANWFRWGHAVSSPQPGDVGVRSHHVFLVLAVLGHGRVLGQGGNEGNAVRTSVRSGAGYRWRRP